MHKGFSLISESRSWDLIEQYPLAWLVPEHEPAAALLMPMIRKSPNERVLECHVPRQLPLADDLIAGNFRLTALFTGPHAYISPRVAEVDTWGPTWNFASVKVSGSARMVSDRTEEILMRVSAHMEGEDELDWIRRRMGARFDELAKRVIGFELAVKTIVPRFKLGQDETPEVRERIIRSLADHPLGEKMVQEANLDET